SQRVRTRLSRWAEVTVAVVSIPAYWLVYVWGSQYLNDFAVAPASCRLSGRRHVCPSHETNSFPVRATRTARQPAGTPALLGIVERIPTRFIPRQVTRVVVQQIVEVRFVERE